jgi:hypothetical protein
MQIKYNDKLTKEQRTSINNFQSYLSKPKPVVKNIPIPEPEPIKEHVHLHDLMTPKEVEEYLSISAMTLKRWTRVGRINCIRINDIGHRRYLRSEIERITKGTE